MPGHNRPKKCQTSLLSAFFFDNISGLNSEIFEDLRVLRPPNFEVIIFNACLIQWLLLSINL